RTVAGSRARRSATSLPATSRRASSCRPRRRSPIISYGHGLRATDTIECPLGREGMGATASIRHVPFLAGVRPRIDAKYAHLFGEEAQFLKRVPHAEVVRVALDIGIEERGSEGAELIALQLGHIYAVSREAAQSLVEGGRHVADSEDEGRHHARLRRRTLD